MTYIKIKTGRGTPNSLNFGEPAIDTSNNVLWIGNSSNNIPFYSDIALANYIKSSSTGFGLYWNNGLLDVSVNSGTGDVTKAYVDASLINRDVSITELNSYILEVSTYVHGLVIPTVDVNKAYVDGSFGYRDTSILDIWTKIGYIDTSLNNIPTGGDVTKAYVDASLAERDISINWLNVNKVNGTTRITVSATEPVAPAAGDLWIDIS